MAIQATSQWHLRPGVSGGINGAGAGGYDAGISGAGTNYADQDSPQVVFSAGNSNLLSASAGSTTVTSAGTPFTSAMVGNCIKITSGTNFTPGYYFITGYTSTSAVTLDRAPAASAGSGGVGVLGGALAEIRTLSTGYSGGAAGTTLTSPLGAGHTVYARGAGSRFPTVADYVIGAYMTFVNGSANLPIKWVGVNGRPRFNCPGMVWYGLTHHVFQSLKLVATGAANNSLGIIYCSGASGQLYDVEIDQAGFDIVGATAVRFIGCSFLNTGSTSAGNYFSIATASYGALVMGCKIDQWRGGGIRLANIAHAIGNTVSNCPNVGIDVIYTDINYNNSVIGNVVYGCTNGINVAANVNNVWVTTTLNNIFANNSGYGINIDATATGTTAAINTAARAYLRMNYNAFYLNTSGHRNNLNASPNDVELSVSPFTDAVNGDFSLNNVASGGALLRGVGYPQTIGEYV